MPVRLGPVRVLTAQQFNPSFFEKLTFLVGVGAPKMFASGRFRRSYATDKNVHGAFTN